MNRFPLRFLFTLCFLLFLLSAAQGQKKKTDSLLAAFRNTALPDTSRAKAAAQACYYLAAAGKGDEALQCGYSGLKLAQKAKAAEYEGQVYVHLGSAYLFKGRFDSALWVLQQAFALDQQLLSPATRSALCNNLGKAYYSLGNYPAALENHFKSLQLSESAGDLKGQASSLNNISITYQMMQDMPKSKEYLLKSLALKRKLGGKAGIATGLGNLAILFANEKQYDSAFSYYHEALLLSREISDPGIEARTLANMGNLYHTLNDLPRALACHLRALAIRDSIGDDDGCANSAGIISGIYSDMGQYREALGWAKRSLAIALETGNTDTEMDAHDYLYQAYKGLGQPGEALKHYERFEELYDSLTNEDKQRESARLEMKYLFDKKATADSLKHEIERNRQSETLQREKQTRNFFAAGAAVVLLFSAFLFQRFTVTRKQKQIIEQQKLIVEEKNREVHDSITYAQRLQQAILPSEAFWRSHLPDSFVLYLPKDIVAGDFYWMEESVRPGLIFFAAADCTGHGVPGAMVSVVCSNALKRCVKELHLEQPGIILDEARRMIIETFERSGQSVRDGMDISLCALDVRGRMLHWAGANSPLWLVRNGALTEYKGDKQPVGLFEHAFPFTTHAIRLHPGDRLYIATDGYGDQFGGESGKKFKLRQLREMLPRISSLEAKAQEEALRETFRKWKGALGQVDDVTVIGVNIS